MGFTPFVLHAETRQLSYRLPTTAIRIHSLTLKQRSMESKKEGHKIFVRLDPGEEVFEQLKKLREQYSISNGFIQAIGAVDEVTLAHYDAENQEYSEQAFNTPFEVTNLTGNIGPDKIHAHITVADNSYQVKAGHCSRARVSGTFEILIDLSEKPVLKHAPDDRTGLDVFDLSE